MSNSNWRPSQFLEKPLPCNIEAERTLLGALIVDNDMFDEVSRLDLAAFYSPVNRTIFEAMRNLHQKGTLIDPITIGKEITRLGKTTDATGGITGIANLTIGLPNFTVKSLREYIKILEDELAGRELIRACNEIILRVLDGEDNVRDIILKGDEQILHVYSTLQKGRGRKEGFQSVEELMPEFETRLGDYYHRRIKYVRTGMPEIDDQLEGGGLQKNGLYYLCAPPKAGKSALALEWIRSVTADQGFTALGVSAEMHRLQLVTRMYAKQIGLKYSTFRPGMSQANYNQALKGLKQLAQIPFKISDNMFTFDKIRRHCLREQDLADPQKPLGLIVIDYAQLISLQSVSDLSKRANEVAAISRAFKMLASEMEVPVLAISTINNEAAKSGKFNMFDLKESGNLSYDAEAIFGLNNPNYKYGEVYVRPEVEDIELSILANRGGTTNPVGLKFVGEFLSFMTETEFDKVFRAKVNDDDEPEADDFDFEL